MQQFPVFHRRRKRSQGRHSIIFNCNLITKLHHSQRTSKQITADTTQFTKATCSTTEHYSHATCIWSNAIPNDNLFDWTHKSPSLFVGHFNIWNTGSLQKIKLNLHLESTAEYSSGQSLYGQLSEAHVSMSTVMSWAQQTTTKVPPSCCPGLPTTWNDVSWTLST